MTQAKKKKKSLWEVTSGNLAIEILLHKCVNMHIKLWSVTYLLRKTMWHATAWEKLLIWFCGEVIISATVNTAMYFQIQSLYYD